MTKTIAENIRYIDDANDSVNSNIEEVRSSVSYTLNSTTENLTLNAPLDYEIKEINGENCYVYGYPDKWNFDFEQGNGGTYIIDGKQVSMSGNCGIVSCLNLLYQKSVYSDPSEPVGVNTIDDNERIIVQKVLDNGLCDTDLNDQEKMVQQIVVKL